MLLQQWKLRVNYG